jgi:hypothetical protein
MVIYFFGIPAVTDLFKTANIVKAIKTKLTSLFFGFIVQNY